MGTTAETKPICVLKIVRPDIDQLTLNTNNIKNICIPFPIFH